MLTLTTRLHFPSTELIDLVQSSLSKSQKALLELDGFIQLRLLKLEDSPQQPRRRVSKKTWFIEHQRLEQLRNNIRLARSELSHVIGLCDM